MVEHSVNNARGVPRLYTTDIPGTYGKAKWIRLILWKMDSLRRYNIIAIRGWIEFATDIRINESRKREIGGLKLIVGACAG
jgi:hypothetical protein